jgi:glycosyltransferase involved in cell wall biosynthesis
VSISCIIVSYNNGRLLEHAVRSVVAQTYPVDEIIVADDASTDESRRVIDALSQADPRIRPILREKNLGVSANRDLAVNQARGDFVSTLDGDDYFLPTKIEAEMMALKRSAGLIAFSDVKMSDPRNGRSWVDETAEFAALDQSDKVRWLLRKRIFPRFMTVAKQVHLELGGYQHDLQTWEDWDYMLRLAMTPYRWIHSGTIGLVVRLGTKGLSNLEPYEHARQRLVVVRRNQDSLRAQVGMPFLAVAIGRVLLAGAKWQSMSWYWRVRHRMRRWILGHIDRR